MSTKLLDGTEYIYTVLAKELHTNLHMELLEREKISPKGTKFKVKITNKKTEKSCEYTYQTMLDVTELSLGKVLDTMLAESDNAIYYDNADELPLDVSSKSFVTEEEFEKECEEIYAKAKVTKSDLENILGSLGENLTTELLKTYFPNYPYLN